jgi:hypothetical protein
MDKESLAEVTEPEFAVPTELAIVEQQFTELTDQSSPDQIMEFRDRLAWFNEQYKRVKAFADQSLIERIKRTGEINLPNGERLYLGSPPKYKPLSVPDLLTAILECCAGDIDSVSDCFSSNWFKVSQLRSRFEEAGRPELFGQLIETVREDSLETGKSKLQVEGEFQRSRKKQAKTLSGVRSDFLK